MGSAVSGKTRAAVVWLSLAALVLVAFAVTVAVLNATVYSAGGFARSYVDALARGDTRSALALAAVQPTDASGDELLGASQQGRLRDVRVESDTARPDGSHDVRVRLRLEGSTADVTTTLQVRRAGTTGLLFTQWQFATAPTASIDVTPRHDARFTADGTTITATGADIATRYSVLVPSVFDLAHSSTYLTAATVRVAATRVGAVESATVDVEPRQSFVDKVDRDVTTYLRTTCLPQKVLLPAGCPFGQDVDARLTTDPTWTMTTYPAVALQPTTTAGVWRVTTASGRAHLEVEAQSLYDGHDYRVDEDVPFDVGYLVSIGADDRLTIRPSTPN